MDKIKSILLEKVNFDPLNGEATIEIKIFDDNNKVITLDQLDPTKGDFVFRVFNNANKVFNPDIPLPYSELRTNPADRESLKSQPFAVPTITKNGMYRFQIVAIDNTSGQEITSKQVRLDVSGFPTLTAAAATTIPVSAIKAEYCPPIETPDEDIEVRINWNDEVIDPDLNIPLLGEMWVTKGGRLMKGDITSLMLKLKITRSGRIEIGETKEISKMLNLDPRYQITNPDEYKYIITFASSELPKLYSNYGPKITLEPIIEEGNNKRSVGSATEIIFGKNVATIPVVKTQLQRTNVDDDVHYTKTLWNAVRKRIPDFRQFDSLMNGVLGTYPAMIPPIQDIKKRYSTLDLSTSIKARSQKLHPLPFTNIQAYRLLKSAAQSYLWATNNVYTNQLDQYINSYSSSDPEVLTPYNQVIMERLIEWRDEITGADSENLNTHNFFGIDHLPAVELIWSYWVEQGMMVQTINAVSMRFQNISTNPGTDPLAQIDIDPLRPLANLFWGYIQDEQHTLSIKRRAYEYDHTYGLQLEGRAVPVFKSVDSRSKFIEAFHNLLHSASIFFKESDDTTRVADAFVVLNNLREVHLLLAEGNHNAYGNLTWTARQEMMIQQYILSRPEMREFLGGRIMVPYRENWMDRVDRMRQIQNWGSTSITHYYDLAQHGEILLLTIRAHDWSNEEDSIVAGSWAATFRNEIQRYIHSYRTVTGVDLSADAQLTEASFMQPSVLIQNRLLGEIRGPLRNSRIVGGNQPIRL
jgi:hypothetical protein